MIETFKSKDLKELFETEKSSKIQKSQHKRILVRLDALEQAKSLKDLSLTGFGTHPLNGFNPTRYSISINGPWRITFEFENGNAQNVDIEQYH